MAKKVAVIGSRAFDDYDLLSDTLADYDILQIISGGAKGADSLAKKYAKSNGIDITEHKPD